MGRTDVAIVDYGLGNLYSVERALKKLGAKSVEITQDANVIRAAQRIVLPGVGAFADGMKNLQKLDLSAPLQEAADSGAPILGVCLGMQLLMTQSEEFGVHAGLNLVPGNVRKLRPGNVGRFTIPQIGWNSLHPCQMQSNNYVNWSETLLAQLSSGSFMYFVHSYVVDPEDSTARIATTNYGEDSFCSALRQRNITGVQFHPERSGEDGLLIYQEFLKET